MGARPTKTPGLEPTCLHPRESETARLVMGDRHEMWDAVAAKFESRGLPPIDPVMGGRYWPAVRAFFDRRNRMHEAHDLSEPDHRLPARTRS